MNKQEFLEKLRKSLNGLPKNEVEDRITFYGEIIDDRMEEGLTEEEAVNTIGDINKIVAQVVDETSLVKIAKERIRPQRKLNVKEIIFLVLTSPIWFSLVIAVVSVIFAIYVSLWAIIVSVWSVFLAFIASAICSIPSCVIFLADGSVITGFVMLALGIVCGGLAIITLYGCKKATLGIIKFTKKITLWIKNCFIKKEEK